MDETQVPKDFQRVSVGMSGATGTTGQAMHARGAPRQLWEPKKNQCGHGRNGRTCYVYGKVGHIAKNCQKRQNGQSTGQQAPAAQRGQSPLI
jgi:hypothetical protein